MTNKNKSQTKEGNNSNVQVDISLLKGLEHFGLSELEAKLYILMISNGKEQGGTALARLADMHRQYVYLALPKLLDLGLVAEVGGGIHKKYIARSPFEIEKLAKKRAVEATELATRLNMISNVGNEQDFEVTQGEKSIQEYEMDYVNGLKYGEKHYEYIIGGVTDKFASIMNDKLDEYLKIKQRKNVIVRYLGTKAEQPSYAKYVGKYENQIYKFISKLPGGVTHMVVKNESVSFYSFVNPPLIYTIKCSAVADNYRDFFLMLWGMV